MPADQDASKATIQPPKSTTTATAVRSSRPGKRSRLPRSSPRASKRQRTAMRVTCDALPSDSDLDAWRQRLRHARLARPPAGRRGRASRSVTYNDIETPTIRTQRSDGSKPASTNTARTFDDARRTYNRRSGVEPNDAVSAASGTFAPEAASTHEHKCSSRCAFVSYCDHQRRTRRQSRKHRHHAMRTIL